MTLEPLKKLLGAPGSRRHRLARRLKHKLLESLPSLSPNQPLDAWRSDAERRVLYISACPGDSRRYRCHAMIEGLLSQNLHGQCLPWPDRKLSTPEALLDPLDVVILHRMPATARVLDLIQRAKKQGCLVIYDSDDLIFDDRPQLLNLPGPAQYLDAELCRSNRQVIEQCHAALVSTQPLKRALQALTDRPCEVLRNGLARDLIEASEAARLGISKQPKTLGYASGTPTHDADFASISEVLVKALSKHPEWRLELRGHISVPGALRNFGQRVSKHGFVPWAELPAGLRRWSVMLAPFVDNAFNRCKSALKYREAALLELPTIASPMPAYKKCIESGQNGYLAQSQDQWLAAMERLMDDAEHADELGRAARRAVLVKDSVEERGHRLASLIKSWSQQYLGGDQS